MRVVGYVLAVVLAGLALCAGWVGISYFAFSRQMDGEVASLRAAAIAPGITITEEMLAGLPPPAQRLLRHSGVVGRPMPGLVTLRQKGRIRSAPDAGWMELEAVETYSLSPPAFVWRASMPSRAMPLAIGRDVYAGGRGSILIKLAGTFPVADEHRAELGEAGLMRFLNEMMWFPSAFLLPAVQLEPVDDLHFRATLGDAGLSATAVLAIDADGHVLDFVAQRFDTSTRRMATWRTPISETGVFEGLHLPARGEAVWVRPEGDFSYIELDILDVVSE